MQFRALILGPIRVGQLAIRCFLVRSSAESALIAISWQFSQRRLACVCRVCMKNWQERIKNSARKKQIFFCNKCWFIDKGSTVEGLLKYSGW